MSTHEWLDVNFSFPQLAQGAIVSVSVGPGGNRIFSPVDVTISVGDTVRWTFASSAHTVDSGSDCTPDNSAGTVHTGQQSAGFTIDHTFTAVGTYPYYCDPHCPGMEGSVIGKSNFAFIFKITFHKDAL